MTVSSIARRPEVVGLVLWAGALVAVPAPAAARFWLAVPFVLVPRLAPAIAAGGRAGPMAAFPWSSVLAGASVAVSLVAPRGSATAVALVVPWLLLTLAAVATSIPPRGDARSVAALGRLAADVFLAVGAIALLFQRLGVAPLPFDPTIVLLTAVHFSVAGHVLLDEAILLACAGSRAGRWAIVVLIAGMPMTGAGWLIGTPVAAWPGTIVVATGGVLAAAATAQSGRSRGARARVAAIVSGVLLGAGMTLAIGWSTALVLGVPYLDIAAMVRTHGSLNLVAVLLAAALMRPPEELLRLSQRDASRFDGAVAGFLLGLPVWWWLERESFWVLDGGVVAASALVGPAVAGWLVGATPTRQVTERVVRMLAMVAVTVVAACLFVAAIEALDGNGIAEALASFAWLFALGLLWVGWAAALAAVPFAIAWVWVTDRWGRRIIR